MSECNVFNVQNTDSFKTTLKSRSRILPAKWIIDLLNGLITKKVSPRTHSDQCLLLCPHHFLSFLDHHNWLLSLHHHHFIMPLHRHHFLLLLHTHHFNIQSILTPKQSPSIFCKFGTFGYLLKLSLRSFNLHVTLIKWGLSSQFLQQLVSSAFRNVVVPTLSMYHILCTTLPIFFALHLYPFSRPHSQSSKCLKRETQHKASHFIFQ